MKWIDYEDQLRFVEECLVVRYGIMPDSGVHRDKKSWQRFIYSKKVQNKDSSDDRIENLEKMMHGKHSSLHQIGVDHSGKNNPMYGTHRTGEDNPNWKGGITIDWNKYQRERRWRIKKMVDLIEKILDIFDIDTEDMRQYYRRALEDIFIEQDKITSTEE